ncbi:MAG: hypothetical protein R2882_06505 [Gemmatimonadales bacterium]
MIGRRLLLAGVLLATAAASRPAAAQSTAASQLERRISVSFEGLDLATALTRLRTVFHVPLAFSSDAIRQPQRQPHRHPGTGPDVLSTMLASTPASGSVPLEGVACDRAAAGSRIGNRRPFPDTRDRHRDPESTRSW